MNSVDRKDISKLYKITEVNYIKLIVNTKINEFITQ